MKVCPSRCIYCEQRPPVWGDALCSFCLEAITDQRFIPNNAIVVDAYAKYGLRRLTEMLGCHERFREYLAAHRLP
jgi:hypothetical protein